MSTNKRNIFIGIITSIAVLAVAVVAVCIIIFAKPIIFPINFGINSGRGQIEISSSRTIKKPEIVKTNKQITLRDKETVNLKATPEAGFNFVSYVNKGGEILSTNKECSFEVGENVKEILVKFIPAIYVVTFDYNGATELVTSKAVEFESVFENLPVPTKEGFLFAGWVYHNDGTEKVFKNGSIYDIPKNVTLKVKWSVAHDIVLDFNTDTVNDTEENFIDDDTTLLANGIFIADENEGNTYSIKVGLDVAIGFLPEMKKENFVFKGWYYYEGIGSRGNTSIKLTDENLNMLINKKLTDANAFTSVFPMFVKQVQINFMGIKNDKVKETKVFEIEKGAFNYSFGTAVNGKNYTLTDTNIDWIGKGSSGFIPVSANTSSKDSYNYIMGYSFKSWTMRIVTETIESQDPVDLASQKTEAFVFIDGVCQINTNYDYKVYTATYKNVEDEVAIPDGSSLKLKYQTTTSAIIAGNKFMTPNENELFFKKSGYSFAGWKFICGYEADKITPIYAMIEYEEDFELNAQGESIGMIVVTDPNKFVLDVVPMDKNGVELSEVVFEAVWEINQAVIIYNFVGGNDGLPYTVGGKGIEKRNTIVYKSGASLSAILKDSGMKLVDDKYLPLKSDQLINQDGIAQGEKTKKYIHGYYLHNGAYTENLEQHDKDLPGDDLTWEQIGKKTDPGVAVEIRKKYLYIADNTTDDKVNFSTKREYFNIFKNEAKAQYGYITIFAILNQMPRE